MSTTAIVAEILIIGLQTLAAIIAALFIVHGDVALGESLDVWRRSVADWKDLVAPLTVAGLAAAYTVGVIVDRLADWSDDITLRLIKRGPAGRVRFRRMAVMHKSAEISKFLEYQRSRL